MGSPPAGILFDFGFTLLHEGAFDHASAVRRVLGLARSARGVTVEALCAEIEALEGDLRARREASLLELSPFWVQRLVLEPNGLRFDAPRQEVERAFWEAGARMTPTPGVRETVARLHARGLPMGVVSNAMFTSDTLAWQLAASGLGSFFRFVASSADYAVRKPHPAIFRAAAAKLGLPPEAVWFVGDSLACDVAGANAAGMTSVWYAPEPAATDDACGATPHLRIRDWKELEIAIQATAG